MFEDCCVNFRITSIDDFCGHHHQNCDNYKTKKYPYLFYFDEGLDSWVIAGSDLDSVIEATNLDDGEHREIEFKRIDMTDEEYDNLPGGE